MSKQTKKNVKMIDVADKKVTKRTAIAEAFINSNIYFRKKWSSFKPNSRRCL